MNNVKTVFHASRSIARNAAKEVNGKVIDKGTKAAAGQRWAVEFVEVKKVLTVPKYAKPSNKFVTHAVSLKGKVVPVKVKRSKIACMLAAHMAKSF